MKEAIFHPEARAEVRESVEFYETRLDGLGLRFLAAVEGTAERISANPEAGAPLAGGFRKRIVLGFPYNELQFLGDVTTVRGTQRLASAVYPLFVPGGDEDVASFQVWGRHYDDPVERILDLGDDEWRRISQRSNRDALFWLGPLPDEIMRGAASPRHWLLRAQEAPGDDGVLESTAQTLVVLPGSVGDAIYTVADAAARVEDRWEPARWLFDQLARRQRLVTRETSQSIDPDDRA